MGLYKYVRQAWKKPSETISELMKKRIIEWRREPTTIRIDRPTRIDRARSLGYRAKQGFIVVRQRLIRGGRQREKFRKGRRPKHRRQIKILDKSYRQVAEERANRKYVNCEVLNSYFVAKDGKYYWYEIILIDRAHPAIKNDKKIKWIASSKHRGRVYRGLTSAGKKSRGLRK